MSLASGTLSNYQKVKLSKSQETAFVSRNINSDVASGKSPELVSVFIEAGRNLKSIFLNN
jgi:hypothetical protein